jgi:hypothetical protein
MPRPVDCGLMSFGEKAKIGCDSGGRWCEAVKFLSFMVNKFSAASRFREAGRAPRFVGVSGISDERFLHHTSLERTGASWLA